MMKNKFVTGFVTGKEALRAFKNGCMLCIISKGYQPNIYTYFYCKDLKDVFIKSDTFKLYPRLKDKTFINQQFKCFPPIKKEDVVKILKRGGIIRTRGGRYDYRYKKGVLYYKNVDVDNEHQKCFHSFWSESRPEDKDPFQRLDLNIQYYLVYDIENNEQL